MNLHAITMALHCAEGSIKMDNGSAIQPFRSLLSRGPDRDGSSLESAGRLCATAIDTLMAVWVA
ncbi:MAG TPA: hypothetical protein VIM34_12510 [Burkholderiaceae bacterium]